MSVATFERLGQSLRRPVDPPPPSGTGAQATLIRARRRMSAGAPAERYNLACAWPLSQPLSGGLPLPAVVAPRSCELLQEPGERAAVHASITQGDDTDLLHNIRTYLQRAPKTFV